MILASSPGWNCSEPTCTHSRAPFTVWPMPGNAGSMSSPIAVSPKRYL